ncbi:peptidase [Pseudoalteromonas sp. NEC-BIFX-2020_002]|uniref:S41 family peptidase n=1 Tax=unclassified Pseudoalteromonas TaxID=194690 RepID=UPI0014770807|nr:S41 family peptidase [Pseudoalteromonas sp. NEC-BIFX-2020_002]NNG44084.1 peptidase [Pseudoalteromonas sp. NEC-BIFX-2020_002]
MTTSSKNKLILGLFNVTFLAVLTGCGGGSTMADSGGSTGNTISWTQGVFQPSDNFDKQCQALNQKHFLRSWSNETYLWYDEIIDRDPALTASVSDYFTLLKTEQKTDSGANKDNFHSSLSTAEWEAQSQSGITFGYGFKVKLFSSSAPRKGLISYTEANSPASNQNLRRGFEILEVNGVDFINATSQADVDTLNAGLYPKQTGVSTTFLFKDINNQQTREVTLISQSIASQPVTNVKTFENDSVGYFQFNSHNAIAEKPLFDAFNSLKASNVTDLIIDMRYNGGGFLQMASQIGYMIAGAANTNNKIFERTIFNDKHPTINPVTAKPLAPVMFIDEFIGFAENPAVSPGTPLPSLNLKRVYVLTTSSTCSASEAIINGLQGADIEVIQIGSGTCGKPYGFYPTDNCDTTYFSIQFTGENNKGFGEYSDGFAPQNTVDNERLPVRIAGCAVADDFSYQLGDPNEALLKTALSYRSNGSCPVATSTASIQGFAPSSVSDTPDVFDNRATTLIETNKVLPSN